MVHRRPINTINKRIDCLEVIQVLLGGEEDPTNTCQKRLEMTLLNLTEKITLNQTKWERKIHVADFG